MTRDTLDSIISGRCSASRDELAERSVDMTDQAEPSEPAEDEGEKMAQRIWQKVEEQLPPEHRKPALAEDHC
jgi:hypothetical protein